jgi:hypothetical protein
MLRVLNLGAGVQSTTIFLLARDGEIDWFDHAVFADTQEEPRAVYEHLEWLKRLSSPAPLIHTGTAGKLGDDLSRGIHSTGQRFASIPAFTAPPPEERSPDWKEGVTRRQCTSEYKIAVVDRTIRRVILGLKPRQRWPKDVTLTQIFGISYDERDRAVRIEKRVVAAGHAAEFPLIEKRWTREMCLTWLKPRVPHEVPRSACVFCPWKRAAEWLKTKAHPDEWARCLEIDNAIRTPGTIVNRGLDQQLYLHRSCLPLEKIDFEAEAERDKQRYSLALWNDDFAANDCGEGMCGL